MLPLPASAYTAASICVTEGRRAVCGIGAGVESSVFDTIDGSRIGRPVRGIPLLYTDDWYGGGFGFDIFNVLESGSAQTREKEGE